MIKKLSSILTQCAYIIFALFWTWVATLVLFFTGENYYGKKIFLLSNIFLLGLAVLVIVLVWAVSLHTQDTNAKTAENSKSAKKISKKAKSGKCSKIQIGINVLTAGLFVVQLFVFSHVYFHTENWDPWTVYRTAEKISRGDTQGLFNRYFSAFPNNQFIAYVQSILIRMNRSLGIFDQDGFFFMIAVQCLLTSITGKLLYENLKLIGCSKKYSMIGWILYVVLLGLSGWNMVTYTDMMALIFPMAIFRVYLSLKNHQNIILKWAGIVLLSYWGFKMKPTALIVTMAIVIAEVLDIPNKVNAGKRRDLKGQFKSTVKLAITIIACVFISSAAFSAMIASTGLEIDAEGDTGALHMVMMGLNPDTDGGWSEEDANLSVGIARKSVRRQIQMSRIIERLEDYGTSGFIKHMEKKTLAVFNDGTFAWGNEGGFFDYVYPDKDTVISPFLKSVYYTTGSRYAYFATFEHFVWLMVLFSSIGIIFLKKTRETVTITLTMIGIIIFTLLFETRARYLIVCVPFFIMAAALTLQRCEEYVAAKIRK